LNGASTASSVRGRYPVPVPGLRIASLALLVTLAAAACGGGVPASDAAGEPDGAEPTAMVSPAGSPPAAPPASDAPATTQPTPEATEDPSSPEEPETSDPPTSSEEATDDVAGGADACSGSDENREFFESFASTVEWPVLCGVLPRGWYVSEGSYRLANGGRLVISYRGPAGASMTLSEGAFCTDGDDCIPDGTEVGGAALGPLAGTLYETPDGFAISAAPGENPSWQLATHGLDRATATTLAAALAEVGR
jgi:hypothetical protein